MKANLWEIYKIFFFTGIQLLGGGYVIVPLLKKYLVDEKKWITETELVDFYAVSQCIPGITAGNIAVCAGCKTRGIFGALAAVSGIITPPFIMILILAQIFDKISDYPLIQSAFGGIRISVIILIFLTIRDLWEKSMNCAFTYILFFSALLCLLILRLSPALIIIISGAAALIYTKIKGKNNA